jgi:hypothetical protein
LGFTRVAPHRQGLVTDPEREASALAKSGVIVFPIAETVATFGFLGLHTREYLHYRLPALCNKANLNNNFWISTSILSKMRQSCRND